MSCRAVCLFFFFFFFFWKRRVTADFSIPATMSRPSKDRQERRATRQAPPVRVGTTLPPHGYAGGTLQCVVVAVSCCGTDTLCGGYSGEVILCGVVLCVPPPYHAFVLARLDTRCDLVWCSVSCCVEVSCCCTGTICNVVLCVYVRWQWWL